MSRTLLAGVVAAGCLGVLGGWRASAQSTDQVPLVAHEWGTFTALQDDDGTALGAINSDDEPVPDFVHRIGGVNALPARTSLSPFLRNPYSKGLVTCHPDVTMRLETPVIYFYPPAKGQTAPVNVRVRFHGGWLTEFYPQADAVAPDLLGAANSMYPKLAASTSGSLSWKGVVLGAPGEPTKTDDPVWTTPREVPRAALVNVESAPGAASADHPEKFLFYRGVGHLASPLRVLRDPKTDRLSIQADLRSPASADDAGGVARDLIVPAAWLIEIRPGDGFCAFRPVPGPPDLRTPPGQQIASLPASFAPGEFSAGRLQELRVAMRAALVLDGLYPDEADAMLKTWELSYFQSPGRRLFYLTPHAWTDRVLPLSIDGAAISRVMVGRIELVTPAQRAALARLAAGPCPDIKAMSEAYLPTLYPAHEAWIKRVGPDVALHTTWHQPTLAESGVAIPALYQDYLDLGRFRDALVLREQQRRPTAPLAEFVKANQLSVR